MTGRFQAMCGDFGGSKPQAALEFECCRPQALGGANSIGDQVPSRGRPDPAAHDLIGAPARETNETAKSNEGAIRMCEEATTRASYSTRTTPSTASRR